MNDKNTLVLTIKKNDRNAKNSYQYNQLETVRFYFIPCSIEETYDELLFTYNLEGLCHFDEARSMRNADKYGFLIQALEAVSKNPEYTFSLRPENIFLDAQNRIRILERDISNKDEEVNQKLRDIQALAGYLFQKKYTYADLREGGSALLKKQSKTKYLLDMNDLEQASLLFQTRQKEQREKDDKRLVYVNKKGYRRSIWMLGITVAGCVIMIIWIVYQERWVLYPQKSALMAERAYMENNYPQVADALAGISVEQMDPHEKYLLAVVYIKGQSVDSFSMETKERLLAKLSYNGDEHLLDYWIYLGRMEIDHALDVAMRISDHQLLLYAYLQKIDMVSVDQSLSGEEKMQQIETLRGKIKNLAEELGIEYKESSPQTSLEGE